MKVLNYFSKGWDIGPDHKLRTATYTCNICGKQFNLVIGHTTHAGYSQSDGMSCESFETLSDHLTEHLVAKIELESGTTTKEEVRKRIEWKEFIKRALDAKVCPRCGKDIHLETYKPISQVGPMRQRWECKCGFIMYPSDM